MTDKNKLADKNMGLVHACCKRFSGKGIEYEELFASEVAGSNPVTPILTNMREWLSWWSATLPRSRPRVRVPSRALFYYCGSFDLSGFPLFCIFIFM